MIEYYDRKYTLHGGNELCLRRLVLTLVLQTPVLP